MSLVNSLTPSEDYRRPLGANVMNAEPEKFTVIHLILFVQRVVASVVQTSFAIVEHPAPTLCAAGGSGTE